MPEVQMDVAVANRFISSLSKSLQALCHGCMDFDNGIEIVGYINVNIDCGSKVDYVLNEKVLKSTTNSMTFVSNSFLAKKEQAKQTRDGSCSPIPELRPQPQVMPSYQSRVRGSYHGSHPRSGVPFSQSYVLRGGHKRSWTGMERDWRMSPKKQRDGRLHEPSSTVQSAHHPSASSSSQSMSDQDFRRPQTSQSSFADTGGTESQPDINIKKEILDSDSEKLTSQNEQDQSHPSDQNANDSSDQNPPSSSINIKSDPDAATGAGDETAVKDNATDDTQADFKGTFLQPSTSEDTQQQGTPEESNIQAAESDDDKSLSQAETAASSSQNLAPDEGSEEHEDTGAGEVAPDDNVTPGSEMPVEYDEAGEEGAYPQSVYSDAGEGSSDTGQFEVIEIDDEDEDVQAMFGESQSQIQKNRRGRHLQTFPGNPYSVVRSHRNLDKPGYSSNSSNSPMGPSPGNMEMNLARHPAGGVWCNICHMPVADGRGFKAHMSQFHGQVMPLTCSLCGKGYVSESGLSLHMQTHEGKTFLCPVCDARFTQNSTMKRHLRSLHKTTQCFTCKGLFKLGSEYEQHVLHCSS